MSVFRRGLRAGLPIGLGYFPVSFTFGFLTVAGGLPWWVGALISLTNLTSAGQFAGLNLILAGGSYVEVALTTLVVNLRYMLMSLSLSQKIETQTPVWKRMLFAFGITDETFVVASMEKPPVKAAYMFGLIIFPIIGWNMGTIAGGVHIRNFAASTEKCHGHSYLCNVYCNYYSSGTSFRKGVHDYRNRSGCNVRIEVHSDVLFYFIGLSRYHCHCGGSRYRRVAVSEGR